jgi:hypothetical protein
MRIRPFHWQPLSLTLGFQLNKSRRVSDIDCVNVNDLDVSTVLTGNGWAYDPVSQTLTVPPLARIPSGGVSSGMHSIMIFKLQGSITEIDLRHVHFGDIPVGCGYGSGGGSMIMSVDPTDDSCAQYSCTIITGKQMTGDYSEVLLRYRLMSWRDQSGKARD